MTNTQLLILATCLVLICLYWKYYSNATIAPKPDDIIERKDKQKELFFDATEFSDEKENE